MSQQTGASTADEQAAAGIETLLVAAAGGVALAAIPGVSPAIIAAAPVAAIVHMVLSGGSD